MSPHKWIPSTLGHGSQMCEKCHATVEELTALGRLESCDASDEEPEQRVYEIARAICRGHGRDPEEICTVDVYGNDVEHPYPAWMEYQRAARWVANI